MPMNPIIENPDFNGVRYSRTSCDLRFDAFKIGGWKSMSIKTPLKPGKTWGNRAKPMGRTTGKFDPSAELELYQEDWINLVGYLTAKGLALGQGYKQVSSLVMLTIFEVVRGTVIYEVLGARISDEDGPNPSDGSDDQLSVKLTLDVMDVFVNGVPSVVETVAPF